MFSHFHKITQKLSPELRKILVSVGWLFVESIASMLLSFIIGIIVIRYLGTENFGKLSYSMSFVGLFEVVTRLGLTEIVVRNIIHKPGETSKLLGTSFAMQLVASVIIFMVINLFSWALVGEMQIRLMILVITFGLFFASFDIIQLWFQSQVLSGSVAKVRSTQVILSSAAKLFFVFFNFSLMAFVWLIVSEYIIRAMGLLIIYYKHHQSLKEWEVNWSLGWQMLQDSYPLIISGVMVTTYMKIDQVMLGNMSTIKEVGNYAAAVRLSSLWYFIPVAICSSVFPSVLRAKQQSKILYEQSIQRLYDIMAALAWVISVIMTILAVPSVNILLGPAFTGTSQILIWHIWSGIFIYLGVPLNQWLIAENLTRFSFLTTSLAAISNVFLNLWLIPLYGGTGAAIATLISYAISCPISCFLYSPIHQNAMMLVNAILLPIRLRQLSLYFNDLKSLVFPSSEI